MDDQPTETSADAPQVDEPSRRPSTRPPRHRGGGSAGRPSTPLAPPGRRSSRWSLCSCWSSPGRSTRSATGVPRNVAPGGPRRRRPHRGRAGRSWSASSPSDYADHAGRDRHASDAPRHHRRRRSGSTVDEDATVAGGAGRRATTASALPPVRLGSALVLRTQHASLSLPGRRRASWPRPWSTSRATTAPSPPSPRSARRTAHFAVVPGRGRRGHRPRAVAGRSPAAAREATDGGPATDPRRRRARGPIPPLAPTPRPRGRRRRRGAGGRAAGRCAPPAAPARSARTRCAPGSRSTRCRTAPSRSTLDQAKVDRRTSRAPSRDVDGHPVDASFT